MLRGSGKIPPHMGHGFVLQFNSLDFQSVGQVREGSEAIGAQFKPRKKVIIRSLVEIPSIGAERSERGADESLHRTHISGQRLKRSRYLAYMRRTAWLAQQEFDNLIQPFSLERKLSEKVAKVVIHL